MLALSEEWGDLVDVTGWSDGSGHDDAELRWWWWYERTVQNLEYVLRAYSYMLCFQYTFDVW